MVRPAIMFSPRLLALSSWMAPPPPPSPREPAPEAPCASFSSYCAAGVSDIDVMPSEDVLRAQAQTAHELLASIRRRHVRLGRFLEAFNTYKANPLGGAMCAEVEERIHQMALLIRAQQNQLKHIIYEYEHGPADCALPMPAVATTPAADYGPCDAQSLPITNWLATVRVAVLKEVISFSINDLDRIEQSPLLVRFPSTAGKIHHAHAWPVASRPIVSI
ncbi:hypothetical protein LPJ61_004716 [Coemansia biformis]|uniref:Uncharacterized protein n=1 Tax=Coemansia biformis TaxID=1286918 RepID=A0A9W7Y4C2_9FUNG|nr:hypothetical protein LPJ61_004716 [Coemansia biformis]